MRAIKVLLIGISAGLLAACGLSTGLGSELSSPLTVLGIGKAAGNPGFDAAARELLITRPLQADPGQTSALAIDRLGMPRRQASQKIENPHAPQQDEWIELEYPDLRLGYYRNGSTGQEVLAYVRVAGREPQLRQELRVGDSLERFQQVLGAMTIVGPDHYEACDRWNRGDCLRLRVNDERVVEVEKMALLD